MRLTLFCLLLAVLGVQANSYSQNTRFSFTYKNTSIKQILDDIKKQSDFEFFYSNDDFDTNVKVDLQVNNASVDEVLQKIVDPAILKFNVIDKTVVISNVSAKNLNGGSQQKSVSGKVTDTSGNPVPGVSVVVKGTTNGTITDANGNYSISVAEKSTLQFSFVGMKAQELAIGTKTTVNVVLEEETVGLNEVVVIGYGTQKKVNVVGSIAQVSGEKLENRPLPNLSGGLTGILPGVTVTQSTGKPGADGNTIRVRGVGSFGATPDALVLVDGIPGTMNDINVADVESVSVLKDASTAAIYGARAANGVILITTKKGKEGKTKVNYSGYVGWQTATELPDQVNSWEYAQMANVVTPNTYTDAQIATFKSGSDPDNYPNTNFMNDVFSRKGITTAHDVSVNGGSDKTKYFVSFGYLNQQGLVQNNYYERYNGRLNLTTQLFDKLALSVMLSGSSEDRNEPQANGSVDAGGLEGIVIYAVRFPGIYVGQYKDGTYGVGNNNVGTPTAWLRSGSFVRTPSSKFNNNMRLDWNAAKELTFSAIVGYNYTIDNSRSYRASQILNPNLTLPTSFLDQYRNETKYKTLQGLANYSKIIGKHDLGLLLGYSFEAQDISFFSGYRESFPSNDYTQMSMGGTSNQQAAGYLAGWALQSYFGRLKYNYQQKYLFEATVRYDGSSRFPAGRKYGTFPSLAGGWRISEEPFFKPLTHVISNLKLKTSWGILGNQNISNNDKESGTAPEPNYYPYQSTLTSGLNYPLGGQLANGAGVTVLTDPTIHWESTRTIDGGLELGLFNGLIDLDASYFLKNTYDILYQPSSSVSSVLGMGLSQMNMGKLRNSGVELQVSHQKKFRNFNYKVSGNLTVINNKVTSLGIGGVQQLSGMVGNGSNLFIGYPMQMYYGYRTDGVFLSNDEVASWANQTKVNPSSQAGDIRYKDLTGDNVVDQKDMTYLGSSIPKYNYSLSLDAGYKNFDFKVLLQGVSGVKGYMNGYAGWAFYNLGTIQRWQYDGHFDPNQPVRYPAYPRLQAFANTTPPNYVMSDFWVLSSAYLRIKNVQVGYTVPQHMLKRAGIEKVRIYFSGDNLHTLKKYRQGWDPETNNTSGSYYPILATYTFGVNLSF